MCIECRIARQRFSISGFGNVSVAVQMQPCAFIRLGGFHLPHIFSEGDDGEGGVLRAAPAVRFTGIGDLLHHRGDRRMIRIDRQQSADEDRPVAHRGTDVAGKLSLRTRLRDRLWDQPRRQIAPARRQPRGGQVESRLRRNWCITGPLGLSRVDDFRQPTHDRPLGLSGQRQHIAGIGLCLDDVRFVCGLIQ